jgi:deoxyadenosine/deoxycytidine kinase
MADRFVAVAGNIGVGKTTLTSFLTERYGFVPVFEPFADNPYLDKFYGDMERWAFHSQIWFLSHKYRVHCDLERTPGTLVQDRTIYEDAEIFATYLHQSRRMNDTDYATYMELYTAMRNNLAPPDLLIYLKCSVRAIRRRIKQRGRPAEQDIPVTYLRKLNELYDGWIGGWKRCPVLVWDTERLDYLGDLVDRIEFHRAIERFVPS